MGEETDGRWPRAACGTAGGETNDPRAQQAEDNMNMTQWHLDPSLALALPRSGSMGRWQRPPSQPAELASSPCLCTIQHLWFGRTGRCGLKGREEDRVYTVVSCNRGRYSVVVIVDEGI